MFLKQRRAPLALNIACSDNYFHTAFDVQCLRFFATPTSLRKSFKEMADRNEAALFDTAFLCRLNGVARICSSLTFPS